VVRALAELEEGRVPFTMADLAERAGISRATLYRDAGLRDLVGTKGDGPRARPVDARATRN
jgi:predicted DNA-binding transcriptional regulator YafY